MNQKFPFLTKSLAEKTGLKVTFILSWTTRLESIGLAKKFHKNWAFNEDAVEWLVNYVENNPLSKPRNYKKRGKQNG